MLNAIIAILVEKEVLTEEDGLAVVEELKYSMLPGDFESSRAMIKKLFAKIEKNRPIDYTMD